MQHLHLLASSGPPASNLAVPLCNQSLESANAADESLHSPLAHLRVYSLFGDDVESIGDHVHMMLDTWLLVKYCWLALSLVCLLCCLSAS